MRYLITTLFLLVSSNAWADSIDQTLSADPDGHVDIEVISGSVTIIAWDKAEVKVSGDGPEQEGAFKFKSSGNETEISIEPKQGFWSDSNDSGVELTVYVPAGSAISTEAKSAVFDINGVLGNIDASNISGDILLRGGRGKIELESVSGNISIENASGKMNLASVSGDISVAGESSDFDAHTVSGDIVASIQLAESVELQSVSGDIDLDFSLAEDGRLEADTVSGDIDINFSNNNVDAKFDIETGPGGELVNSISNDQIDDRSRFSGEAEFKIGDGSGSVNIETMSGTIKLDN